LIVPLSARRCCVVKSSISFLSNKVNSQN
jgi:hypothetical protein